MLGGNGMKKKQIFIIEDDLAICELLEMALKLEGYSTHVAHDGKAALEKLKTIPKPDLILLDNMMPLMSGAEFLATIQNDHLLVTIPVAMVSAFDEPTSPSFVNEGERPSRIFIKKPIDFDALLAFVREWCG